jgi:hypothetical protein
MKFQTLKVLTNFPFVVTNPRASSRLRPAMSTKEARGEDDANVTACDPANDRFEWTTTTTLTTNRKHDDDDDDDVELGELRTTTKRTAGDVAAVVAADPVGTPSVSSWGKGGKRVKTDGNEDGRNDYDYDDYERQRRTSSVDMPEKSAGTPGTTTTTTTGTTTMEEEDEDGMFGKLMDGGVCGDAAKGKPTTALKPTATGEDPYARARAHKKAAEMLRKRRDADGRLSDERLSEVLRLYARAAVGFVAAAVRTRDLEKKIQNFRDDVQFCRFVATACEDGIGEDVERGTAFRALAYQVVVSRLSCACLARVWRLTRRSVETALSQVRDSERSVELLAVGVKDTKSLMAGMQECSTRLAELRALVPAGDEDAMRVYNVVVACASDCGVGLTGNELVADVEAAITAIENARVKSPQSDDVDAA